MNGLHFRSYVCCTLATLLRELLLEMMILLDEGIGRVSWRFDISRDGDWGVPPVTHDFGAVSGTKLHLEPALNSGN